MTDIQNAFRLVGAELTEFDTKPEIQLSIEKGNSIDFDIAIELMLIQEKRHLRYKIKIGLREKDSTEILGNVNSVTIFEILDFNNQVELIEPDRFGISQDLNLSMERVAIGLTRGLLIAKFKAIGNFNVVVPLLPFEY